MSNEENKTLNDGQPASDEQENSGVNEQTITSNEPEELVEGDGINDDLELIDEEGRLTEDALVSEDDWEDDFDSDSDEDDSEDYEVSGESEEDGDHQEQSLFDASNDEGDALDDSDDSEGGESEDEDVQPEPIKRDQLTQAEYYEQVTEQAKLAVKQITGEDYDEFDPKHKIILTDQAAKIMQVKDSEQKALSRVDEIMNSAGQGFDKFLQNAMQELSVKKYNELLAAEQRGDYSKTLAVVEEAAQAFTGRPDKAAIQKQASEKARQLNSKKPNGNKNVPPKMIKPGAGNRASASPRSSSGTFGLSDIGMSEEDF